MKKLLLLLLIPTLLYGQEPEYVKDMTLISAKIKLKESKNSLNWRLINQEDNRIILYFNRFFDNLPLFAMVHKRKKSLKIDFFLADLHENILVENNKGYVERISADKDAGVYYELQPINIAEMAAEGVKCFSVNTPKNEAGETVYLAKNIIRGGFLVLGKEIYNLSSTINTDVLYAAAYVLSPGISWADYAKAAGIPKKILEDNKI